MKVDSATGGPWETLGRTIAQGGLKDGSGLRRALTHALADNDYALFSKILPTRRDDFDALRSHALNVFGEPG